VECWKTPAASRSADLGAAQQVLGAYLAGETSPLYKELVLEKQLVESLGPNAEAHRDPNLFCLEAKLTDEQHRAPVAKAMHDAVAHVLEGGVDAARVQAIVDHLHFALLMSFESQDDVALALAYPAAVFGPVDALERAAQATLRVTPRALVDFAKANLVDAGRTTLTFEAPTRGGAP
jgi:zinc protease